MNTGHIQNLRYKLQKRVRRLRSTDFSFFHYVLQQFWNFITEHQIFMGIIQDLIQRFPEAINDAEDIMRGINSHVSSVEFKQAAISYHVIKYCVKASNDTVERQCLLPFNKIGNAQENIEYFYLLFIEPLYEYIDEQLDEQRAIIEFLRRYKHKCEWFQRKNLFDLWNKGTGRGEKLLCLHLYEYLHDQGLDFTIEPSSASGEADIVSSQTGEHPLIADAKIFNPERGKSYICRGFNQIYQYTLDFNENFGYLIIFKTCPEDLKLALPNQEFSIPFVTHNNKTIFILTIDIYPHPLPASKRGPLESIEITADDLISYSPEI